MTMKSQPRPRAGDQAPRAATRLQILEAAGTLFSERGYDAVTGREICLKAGVNSAAINYHFGGMEGLYAAVLDEARERFVSQGAIMAAITQGETPEEKLTAVGRLAMRAVLSRGPDAWAPRLISRELTSPSSAGVALLIATTKPRFAILRQLVQSAAGLPEGHPAIDRCCLTLMAPFQILMITDHSRLTGLYPTLDLSPDNVDVLVEHVVRFGLAGVRAVAEAERDRG